MDTNIIMIMKKKPETDSESKVTGVKNTVSAYGGGSYASF